MTSPPPNTPERQWEPAASSHSGAPPLIMMTPDMTDPGIRATEQEYVVRANYAEAIAEAGGVALILPYEPAAISTAMVLADGILITGTRPGAEVASKRIDFERDLIGRALKLGKPLLGICHGMQLIGEYLGGTIVKDHPGLDGDITPHIPSEIPDRLAHDILIASESNLFAWHPERVATVNSLHRHALEGDGRFRVAAWAAGGLVEAIEGVASGFCLGVQWHPEYRLTQLDRTILSVFVRACGSGTSRSSRPATKS